MPTDLPTRLCPICWNPFTPTTRNPRQTYCDTDCRREHWRRQRDTATHPPAPRADPS
ncbi:MAG: hypothetical protein ACRDNS_17920 [Trebonia sp.]